MKDTTVKEKFISVKPETYERIKKLAAQEDRTIRSIVERAVRAYDAKESR